jgi:hypothetical protein
MIPAIPCEVDASNVGCFCANDPEANTKKILDEREKIKMLIPFMIDDTGSGVQSVL